jgi:phosphoglycolate phosphatase
MKGIIFDLDGTLLDTLPDLLYSINASLSELGYETIDDVKLKSFIGDGARNLVRRCIGDGATEEAVDKLLAVYGRIYSANLTVRTKPFEKMTSVLSLLDSEGIRLSVLSNKPDGQTKAIIEHYFPEIPFVCVQGKIDGVPLKPDPFSAINIASKMGISPSQTVFIGDSPVDFRTSVNAGMKCVSVLWGYRKKSDFEGLDQAFFAEKPIDLLSVLKNFR